MSYGNIGFRPEEWIRTPVSNVGIDTNKVLGLRYIGSAASGLVTIAATTNDFTLEHGVLGAEAVDSTVGSAGVLDLTTYTTIQKLLVEINSSPNWEAVAIDLPGDYLTNISAGNGIFIVASPWNAAVQAKTGGMIYPLRDTSLGTIEDFGVGITLNGPSSTPHNFDAQVLHEVLEFTANVTFAGSSDGIYVYECDDLKGTKKEIAHYALTSATATTFGNGIEPLFSVKDKRIVIIAKDASAELTPVGTTTPTIVVTRRSLIKGPGMNKNKRRSAY